MEHFKDLMALDTDTFIRLLNNMTIAPRGILARIRGRSDLEFFAKWYFPKDCRLGWSLFHEDLLRDRAARSKPAERREGALLGLWLAPRGAAKSTLMSLIFPIHGMLYGIEPYTVLFTATDRQAEKRSSNVIGHIKDNMRLHESFAKELKSFRKGADGTIFLNDCRYDFYSAWSEVRGISHGAYRPSWVILDDVERSDRVRYEDHRKALVNWFNEIVENLGDVYTNIDLVGTLLHPKALPMTLKDRPGSKLHLYRSIISEAKNKEPWEIWRGILNDLTNERRNHDSLDYFGEHRKEMMAGAKVLWPEKEDYYALCLKREKIGRSAFDKEKQNAPWQDSQRLFADTHPRYFEIQGADIVCDPRENPAISLNRRYLEQPRFPLSELSYFGFLDPSLGGLEGDDAAIAVIGIAQNGLAFLVELWLRKASPYEQICKIFDLYAKWDFTFFGVETNAFQKILIEAAEQERDLRRRAGKPWTVPINQYNSLGSKEDRISGLEPYLRNGWLLLNRDLPDDFMTQFADYPHVKHDDGLDSVSLCFNATNHGNRVSADFELVQPAARLAGW